MMGPPEPDGTMSTSTPSRSIMSRRKPDRSKSVAPGSRSTRRSTSDSGVSSPLANDPKTRTLCAFYLWAIASVSPRCSARISDGRRLNTFMILSRVSGRGMRFPDSYAERFGWLTCESSASRFWLSPARILFSAISLVMGQVYRGDISLG